MGGFDFHSCHFVIFYIFNLQLKIIGHRKKQGGVAYTQEK